MKRTPLSYWRPQEYVFRFLYNVTFKSLPYFLGSVMIFALIGYAVGAEKTRSELKEII